MIKILVTGASGQLGLSIQDISKEYPTIDFYFKDSKELDISNEKIVNQTFNQNNFDYCINCAAYTNVEQAEKTPELAFAVNAEGVKNIAKACKAFDVTLINISTDYVFDGEKNEPYTTEDTPNPINEYGKSKLAGEKYIQEILDDYFIIRTSWLYSKVHGKNFYKTILEKAQKGELISVTDEQIGCPTNVDNLTKYLLHIISTNSDNYGIHHFTDGVAMTWFDFAVQILKNNSFNPKMLLVKDRNYRTFAKRPKYSVLK
jgi:dTDP-4-dehydrorhamnose reductase